MSVPPPARLAASLLVAAAVICPDPCPGASGFHLPGARGSALGGVSVVGRSWSPLRVAAFPARGYELRASWARPYGIEGLEVGAMTLRVCSKRAGAILSFQALDTPTPFSEAHLICSWCVAPAGGIVLGAGVDLASLRDLEGTFAREVSTSVGLSIDAPGGWEAGCTAFVPASGGASASGRAFENGGRFRWGLGVPFARWMSFLVEEERGGRESIARLGAEFVLPGGFAVRAGFTDRPFTVSFGMGIARARTALDLAMAQHSALGVTPCATISYGSALGAGEPAEGRRGGGPRAP